MKTRQQPPSYEEVNKIPDDKKGIENLSQMLAHLGQFEFQNYRYLYSNIKYIAFCKDEKDKNGKYIGKDFIGLSSQAETYPLNTAWKAHLSCATQDVSKMWNIVLPILVKHNCPAFKCVRLDSIQHWETSKDRGVANAQFTLYIPEGKEKEYQLVLKEIEQALINNDIRKAEQFPKPDRKIGAYTSVRYSGYYPEKLGVKQPRKYLPADQTKNYNPEKLKDPFEKIKIKKQKTIEKSIVDVKPLEQPLKQPQPDTGLVKKFFDKQEEKNKAKFFSPEDLKNLQEKYLKKK